MDALVERIKNVVCGRAEKVINAYLQKRDMKEGLLDNLVCSDVEFYKTAMVNIDNVWYRCNVRYLYTCTPYISYGDFLTPDYYKMSESYDAYVHGIVEEKTKQRVL